MSIDINKIAQEKITEMEKIENGKTRYFKSSTCK